MKSYIFDLDGVIVHTDHYHYLGWKKLADRLGIYYDEMINNQCRGVSRMESLAIVLGERAGGFTAAELERLAAEKNEYYKNLLREMTPDDVSDDVRETLRELKRRGHKLAIGSSSKNAGIILEHCALTEFFDAVADGSHITKSKPDPEVFLKASAFLGEPPANCIVVEDAAAGIAAGQAAGMYTVAIGDAARSGVADRNIEKLSDLLVDFRPTRRSADTGTPYRPAVLP
jgi:beta-phosphoglucomutase